MGSVEFSICVCLCRLYYHRFLCAITPSVLSVICFLFPCLDLFFFFLSFFKSHLYDFSHNFCFFNALLENTLNSFRHYCDKGFYHN